VRSIYEPVIASENAKGNENYDPQVLHKLRHDLNSAFGVIIPLDDWGEMTSAEAIAILISQKLDASNKLPISARI